MSNAVPPPNSDGSIWVDGAVKSGYTFQTMKGYAAAVTAERDAEIAGLREELDRLRQVQRSLSDKLMAERERIKVLEDALQFIAGHDLNGADDRARAIICGLFIIKAKNALAARAALGDKGID